MDCEVCGKTIFGRSKRVIIDGARLLVCSECAKSATPKPRYESSKPAPSTERKSSRTLRRRIRRRAQRLVPEDSVLVGDYGRRIRRGRERIGLSHEELSRKVGERISLLQKLETEKMTPDLTTARKLEGALKIKLLAPPDQVNVGQEMLKHKPAALTLGDVAVMQKRKDR